MATRAIIVFKDGKQTYAVMYRHTDGYPTGLGEELRDFLTRFTSINTAKDPHHKPGWISVVDSGPRVANGIGCLAAQVVAHFKDGPGDVYLQPAGVNGGAEFRYTVFALPSDSIGLKVEEKCADIDPSGTAVRAGWQVLFAGALSDFDPEAAEAVAHEPPCPTSGVG